MRYALCLSGFMRFLASYLPAKDMHRNFESSFYDLPLDIFISTWNIAGIQKGKIQCYAYRWPEVCVDHGLLQSLYGERLKGCQVLPYDPRNLTPAWLLEHATDDTCLGQRLSSMYYHIYEANRLKQEYAQAHGIKYDVTIRCRADLNFHFSKSSDQISASEIKPGRVYVPHCESYGHTNDQFMFGDSETMDQVAQCYQNIVARSPLIQCGPEPHNPFHPAERMFHLYLHGLGLEVVKCGVEYTRSS